MAAQCEAMALITHLPEVIPAEASNVFVAIAAGPLCLEDFQCFSNLSAERCRGGEAEPCGVQVTPGRPVRLNRPVALVGGVSTLTLRFAACLI